MIERLVSDYQSMKNKVDLKAVSSCTILLASLFAFSSCGNLDANYVKRTTRHPSQIEYVKKNYTYDGRIIRKEDTLDGFLYNDDVSRVADKMVEMGYFRNPEAFVLAVRCVYFEGAYDKEARNLYDIKRGLEAISLVVKERFDSETYRKKGETILDLLYKKNQFECVATDKKREESEKEMPYLKIHKGVPGWSMYEGGRLNYAVGAMRDSPRRSYLAYRALVDVLFGYVDNFIGGATSFKNPKFSSANQTDYHWRTRDKKVPVAWINSMSYWIEERLATHYQLANYEKFMTGIVVFDKQKKRRPRSVKKHVAFKRKSVKILHTVHKRRPKNDNVLVARNKRSKKNEKIIN